MASYKSHNDLSANAKAVSIGILNARLADSIDLALLTKQAHWNIKGPQFIALHEMIDGFRTELDDHVDTMAERVVQLGGTALGTTQTVVKATTLAPYPTDIYASKDHLAALIERYGKVANATRAAIDETDDAGDADTADLLTCLLARARQGTLVPRSARAREGIVGAAAAGIAAAYQPRRKSQPIHFVEKLSKDATFCKFLRDYGIVIFA